MKTFCCALLLICAPALAQSPMDDAQGLWAEAVLYRDGWGVPHVYADNSRAMAFAFGYAQAEDHIERMLIAYRLANGRAAEIFGEDLAAADELAIRLGHADLAWQAYEYADRITQDLCEGFALGVNTWLVEHPNKAPAWAEGVRPADVLALLHRYQLSQAPFDHPETFHMLPATPSANAWAVGPSRSQSGDAMLVMNPHVDYDNAFQWYEAHLVTKDLNVYGATLFGLPVILQGHNGDLGWALSPNRPDIADLYAEMPARGPAPNPKSMMANRRNTRAPGIQYLEDEARPYYVWSKRGFDERSVRRQRTGRGPIVGESQGFPLAWRVGGYEDFGALRQLYDMGRASDLDGFRRALDRQQLSTFHVLYADQGGNLFYQYNATTGERQDPRLAAGAAVFANASATDLAELYQHPLSTREGAFGWGDTIPPRGLPWLLNPDSGYVQACGSPPWLVTARSGMNPGAWPAWLVQDTDSYRAKRVRTLFSLGPRSFEDMQAMLFDTVVPLAAEAVPFLLDAAQAHPEFMRSAHPDLQVALDMLREWNYLAEPGSFAMTYFHVWWSILRLDENGAPRRDEIVHRLIQENAPWYQNHALYSAAKAAELLRNEYQTMNVPWGDVHVVERGSRREAIGGGSSGAPIFHTGDRQFVNGAWRVHEGLGFAMIVRFGDEPHAVSLVPFGSSEDPDSLHFDDQLDLLLGRRFKVTRFARDDVERHAESALGMRILLRPMHQEGTVYVESENRVEVQLAEAEATPAKLPTGTAAFTTYVEPIVQAGMGRAAFDVELRVHERVCAAEHLDALYTYAYHPVTGWHEVAEQTIDPARRTFVARTYQSEVFAVLGPEEYRLAAPMAVARDAARSAQQETSAGSASRPRKAPQRFEGPGIHLGAPVSQEDVTRVARNADAEMPSIAEDEQERVARLFPPGAPQPDVEAVPNYDEPGNIRVGRHFPVITPTVPPGFKPQRDVKAPPGYAPNAGKSSSARDEPGQEPASPGGQHPAEAGGENPAEPDEPRRVAARKPELETESLAPPENAPAPASPPPSVEEPTEPVPATEATAPNAAAEAVPDEPAEERRGRVLMSDKTPAELLGRDRTRRQGFALAPDPSRASEVQLGNHLELRTPDGAALFTVRTKESVRGQAYLRRSPPAPYPDGLVAASPLYEVLVDPEAAGGNTALTLRLMPGTVNPARFDELTLYVYDRAQGWIPLAGQRRDSQAFSFSGLDFGTRTYVVLGPADAIARR